MKIVRRPNTVLLVALAVTVVYGSVAAWRHANRPPGRWVGYTECSWFGPPKITIWPGIHGPDSAGALAHEQVHAAECRALGPVRYRWRTLFAASNLALETPAYCASATERTRLTRDTAFERGAVTRDMMAAMSDVIDSATIVRAIAAACPQFAARH